MTRSPGLISVRVPPLISSLKDRKILVIGEAPGETEVEERVPFIGKAGQLQQRYFDRLNIDRSEISYMNLCNYRPKGNDFENCLGTHELEEGLDEIRTELRAHKYNVILAMGGWPLFFMTGQCGIKNNKPIPGSGIMLYRGSRLAAQDVYGGSSQKVFATFHPSFVLRTWSWNPVFFVDLQHVVEDSLYPELAHPVFESHINPPSDILHTLVHRALQAEWISIDIETFRGGKFSCVGFGWREGDKDIGVCITFQRADLWRFAKQIWESDTPKIFQYGTYDISFMRHFYGWKVGGYYGGQGWDTYVASASLLPDFPRRLDFLCSIHTRFPYYKEERKVWREAGDMTVLWNYNLKDVIATLHIAYVQMGEIQDLFKGLKAS